MKPLFVLACIVLLVLLIGQLRVGCKAEYMTKGLFVWIRIGPIHVQLYPLPTKKEKKKTVAQQKQQPSAKQPQPTDVERLGGAIDYARALVPLVLQAVGYFHRQLQVDTLRLELQVGAVDPADAAMKYGQANATLGAIWLPLTHAFHVKDGHAKVNLSFETSQTLLYGTVALSLKIGQILWLGLFFGGKGLLSFLSIRKQHKQEQKLRKAA